MPVSEDSNSEDSFSSGDEEWEAEMARARNVAREEVSSDEDGGGEDSYGDSTDRERRSPLRSLPDGGRRLQRRVTGSVGQLWRQCRGAAASGAAPLLGPRLEPLRRRPRCPHLSRCCRGGRGSG